MLLRKRNATTISSTSTNGHSSRLTKSSDDDNNKSTTSCAPTSARSSARGRRNAAGAGRGRPRGSTGTRKTPTTSSNRQTPKARRGKKNGRNSSGRNSNNQEWHSSDNENEEEESTRRRAIPCYSTSAELYALEDAAQFSENETSTSDDDEDESTNFIDYDGASTSAATTAGRLEEDEEAAIFCPWIELAPEQIPPLQLPDSSIDLLIESDFILETLEIYEVLQNFYSIIQLTPFLFEDFCCSLRNPGQSKLLCEIHIALIKLFFRDEETEQTSFSTNETRPSFYLTLYLLDQMNYAEVLRHYCESDESFSRDVLNILANDNYPFVSIEKRLLVLKWMCDHFFESNIFKKALKMRGQIKHEKNCRRCGKAGDLFPCAGCESAYHSSCADLQNCSSEGMETDGQQQQQFWFCSICRQHEIRGATDCILPDQTGLRKLPLGYDRNGRIYWFLVRRVFVYTPATNELYYYTTLPQLYELISSLDPEHFERRLCTVIKRLLPFIALQMHNTLELTDERRQMLQYKSPQKLLADSYLHVSNAHLMSRIIAKINEQQVGQAVKNEEESSGIENMEDENDEEDDDEDILKIMRHLLCIQGRKLEATFWSGGLDENHLLLDYKIWKSAIDTDADSAEALTEELNVRLRRGFRLAFSDGGHRNYSNLYCTEELAKAAQIRSKEKDRKRYLCTRYCLTDEGEFLWPNQKSASPFGSEQEVRKCLCLGFRRLVDRIPDGLLHQRWEEEKSGFMNRLQHCENIETLRFLMLIYARALRTPTFMNIWWSGISLIKFTRQTSELREFRQRIENAKRREAKALATADSTDTTSGILWVKFPHGLPKHQLWKMRDEQYRINGIGYFGGWLWVSPNLICRIQLPPNENNKAITQKKSTRLRRIANKLLMWRTVEEFGKQSMNNKLACYSPNCRLISRSCANGAPALGAFCPYHFSLLNQGFCLPCYNPCCSRNSSLLTSHSASAKSPNAIKKEKSRRNNAVGGVSAKPFPFPKPFNFTHKKSGKESILVLPDWCLRRLARQGKILVPGFAFTKTTTYPRPIFDNGWHFLSTQATSIHALALRFRQLYSCIRWMDLWPEDPEDPDIRVWNHTADFDEVRTVVGHFEHPPSGYYEQYKIRVDIYPLGGFDEEEVDDKDTEFGRPQRKKSRKKSRMPDDGDLQKRLQAVKTVERWIDGVDLKLYEIADYWELKRRRQHQHSQRINNNHEDLYSRRTAYPIHHANFIIENQWRYPYQS